MALATRCPHCHTTFRVAHDQLKLRAGLVRCGACKEIFNGIEHLLRPDEEPAVAYPERPTVTGDTPVAAPVATPHAPEARQPITKTDTPSLRAAPSSTQAAQSDESDDSEKFVDFFDLLKPSSPAIQPSADAPDQTVGPSATPVEVDPLQRMTLMDFTDREQDTGASPNHAEPVNGTIPPAETDADRPDPIDQAIDALQRKPRRREDDLAEHQEEEAPHGDFDDWETDEPSFVIHGRRKQRFSRWFGLLTGIGSLLLVAGVVLQGAYAFRNQIAARFPQTKPILVNTCAMIGCQVGLPAQIDVVSLESSELQTLATDKNVFVLTALLRNRGPIVQTWPNIELTLNDASEQAIARRVIIPREYLPATQEPRMGFPASAEQPVKLAFEVSQLIPAGYRVYLFYP